jgi:small-conductance mechanosensitive channel
MATSVAQVRHIHEICYIALRSSLTFSLTEIRHTILAAYKERRYLARALQDASTAIGVLDRLFLAVCVFIVALIAFAVFNVNIYSNLTTAYTIAIAISFIFKSAAQNVFDSVIFLFATHPFDTGDRVVVEEEVFVVKQLGLFSTLFTRWDGTETMIANSKLGTLFITNFRRSPPQFENATLQLGWHTTLEQLDALEARMNEWLQRDEKRM